MAERADKSLLREVLVVEDNPADLQLTIETLKRSQFLARVSAASDGEAALAFLRQQGAYSQAPRPELVFLDGALPKLSGYEVLAAMKADFALRDIPVIMFSSSASEHDVVRAYKGQIALHRQAVFVRGVFVGHKGCRGTMVSSRRPAGRPLAMLILMTG